VLTSSGTPYNLSGCALILTARQNTYFSPILFQKTVTQHLSGDIGLSQFTLVPADTAGVDGSAHYHDVKLNDAAGLITTEQYGPLFVIPQ
jgi:hypothetical protein